MAQSVFVEMKVPGDARKLRLPTALHDRLQELLDRQDSGTRLTARERREAAALAELVDLFAVLRWRIETAAERKR